MFNQPQASLVAHCPVGHMVEHVILGSLVIQIPSVGPGPYAIGTILHHCLLDP